MKHWMRFPITVLSILGVAVCAVVARAGAPVKVGFHEGSIVRFASVDEGRKLIGTADDWVQSFGPLDHQIRLDSKEPVSESEFLDFARVQVLEWDDAEIATMTEVITGMQAKLAALELRLDLPDEILLVQTTGREEGNAGYYTRGDFIVVPEARLSAAPDQIEDTMLHELFHVMTRHNPDVRKPLYEIIGFTYGGAIEYPSELRPLKITNPDAYHFDSYVEVAVGEDTVMVTPLTLSKSETYTGGGIMGNVVIKFLLVEMKEGTMTPVRVDGEPVLYGMNEVSGYVDKIGKNTFYIIHPEEILADNFSLAVRQVKTVANPEILDGIIAALSGKE